MTEKVVFVDVDGVLLPGRAYALPNNEAGYSKVEYPTFCPVAVALVNTILREAKARLVVSSSWGMRPKEFVSRLFTFNDLGVGFLHEDWTIKSPTGRTRLQSLNTWLERHPEIVNWVAFDDYDFGSPNLIKTKFDHGLLLPHYMQAMDMLGCVDPLARRVRHGVYKGR